MSFWYTRVWGLSGLLYASFISAEQDEGERVKGWFPRRCVKLPDSYYSSDSGDKQASSDAKTEQNSKQKTVENHKDEVKEKPPSSSTASKTKGDTQKNPKRTQATAGEGGASGTTPTSGARKRAKKSKTAKKKETNT